MKHIKFLAIAFVSILALASCNTDQEGPIYTPQAENVSFALALSRATPQKMQHTKFLFVSSVQMQKMNLPFTIQWRAIMQKTSPILTMEN